MVPKKSLSLTIFFVLCFFLFTSSISVYAKSRRRSITDDEIATKKRECYADIESGLWGWDCKSSTIAKENCVLQCLSPRCYELVYGGDPLEEGEKDFIRSQEYKYCMISDEEWGKATNYCP